MFQNRLILPILSIFFFTLQTVKTLGQHTDIQLLNSLNPDEPSSSIIRIWSGSAYPISAGVSSGILLTGVLKKDKLMIKEGFELLGSIAVAGLATQTLKWTFDRPRPYETFSSVTPYKRETGQSFPSGHTAIAFATATSIGLKFRKWYIVLPAYTWAAGVGYSRLYLGAHYPSDVLAGAILGTGSAFISRWLTDKLFVVK
jgi:undecaprenyl-diphosphatase